jgi:hypothetical protein
LANIDLGSDVITNRGGNIVQDRVNAGANNGSGICLDIAPDQGQQLNAAGNIFTDPAHTRRFDCSDIGASTEVVLQRTNCTGGGQNNRSGIAGRGLADGDSNPANNNQIVINRCRVTMDVPDGG